MTSLTVLTLVVIAIGMLNPRGYGVALATAGSTAAGAALVVGETAVPTFYAVAIGAFIAVLVKVVGISPLRTVKPGPTPPGVPLLLIFLVWSILVTIVAPFIFDGLRVQSPTSKNATIAAGVVTSSNIAQIIYLILGISVVIFLAWSTNSGPHLLGLVTGLTTLLSLWRYGYVNVGIPFPDRFFDNSPSYKYIETAPGGVQRFRGILSEPAALAGTALVTMSYMLPRAVVVRGARRLGCVAVAGVACYLGIISTSTTFLIAGVLILAIATVTFLIQFLMSRAAVGRVVSIVSFALIIVALWVVPLVVGFIESSVGDKIESDSYAERSDADSASYEVFLNTYGMGVGLGANRASSFVASLASTTGLIGIVLLFAVIVEIVSRSIGLREYRPVVWALVATITLKVISGPDLADSSGILWLSLGLLARAAYVSTIESDAHAPFDGRPASDR